MLSFSGSRVSILDFNKSTQPFTALFQVATTVVPLFLVLYHCLSLIATFMIFFLCRKESWISDECHSVSDNLTVVAHQVQYWNMLLTSETKFILKFSIGKEWMIDNAVVPTATVYGLAKEYKYLKTSIDEFLTGPLSFNSL